MWHDTGSIGVQQAGLHHYICRQLLRQVPHPVEGYVSAYDAETRRLNAGEMGRAFGGLAAPFRFGARLPRVSLGLLSLGLLPKRALALVAMGALVAGTAFGAMIAPQVMAELDMAEQNWACAQMVTSHDAAGVLVDARTVLPDGDCPQPLNADGVMLERPVLYAAYAPDTTMQAADDLGGVEGAWRRADTFFGLDPWGLPRKTWSWARSKVSARPDTAGFSSPIVSGFEVLVNETSGRSVKNKIATLVATALFTSRHLETDEDRAAFMVATMPSVMEGGSGRSGDLAALAIFRHDAPLSLAERCVIAAATRNPVLMQGAREPSQDAARRWATAIGPRAELCVTRRAVNETEAAEALDTLQSMCAGSRLCLDPPAMWQIPEEDRPGLRQRLESTQMQAYTHSAPSFSPVPMGMAGAGLALVDAARLSGAAGGQTSVRMVAQAAVVRAVADFRKTLPQDDQAETVVTVGVVDITTAKPELIALASNAPSGGFFPAAVPGVNGWEFGTPAHALASMNKVPLVIWASGRAITQVCDPACTPLSEIVAESSARIAALLRQDPSGYPAFKAAFGYMGAPGPDYDLATDSIEGSLVRVAPSQLITGVAALYHGAAAAPSVWKDQPIGVMVDLTAMGVDEAARRVARQVLAAPFQPGGTLAAYPGHATIEGCRLDLGKSGTSAVGLTNHERGAIVVHACGDRLFATFVLTANAGGLSIVQAQLAPLHRAAIRAVLSSTSN